MNVPIKGQQPASASRRGSFDDLVVIDRLEVGPVVVERRRVSATYTVVRGRKRDSTKLIYRFEEDVFDRSAESRSLAEMMTAQVALNYGLFCKKIEFRGRFDEHDRRFLETFAENTAREIYVNKFLMENPFLRGTASRMVAERRNRYLQAEIEFVADGIPDDSAGSPGWEPDPARHAVLSSGGKDSLLTFGALREIGREVHPIFVNESGRHWYTALNGYRQLRRAHDSTARVWTNSDRVFAWMLRHLPFVRKDFASVRSDEYPIRLWTVAVFVFGALPLVRKRRIGRLLVGDEYDTTAKSTHQTIPHYNALYDQSRWFDDEMTRYYKRKGWGVHQFSILRPMSELLIEKTLAERYPDLLRHQMSCHATHIKDGRVHPCGSCEKCRRIVGMLAAIGADPTDCGYTSEQIGRCLQDLAEKGVHQEAEGARQLSLMLRLKNLVPAATQAFPSGEHPETLSLRFHPVRSPVETVPQDLRREIYDLFLEHAEGAVRRKGRVWEPYDWRRDLGQTAESDSSESSDSNRGARGNRRSKPKDEPTGYLLGELTWPEAESRFAQVSVALLPVGAVEQHGPHLPLDTDAFDADYLARRVAQACSEPKPLVLPSIPYGVSYHHMDFSGTLTVSPETLARFVYEIGISVARYGVAKLVIINGHGGNSPALHLAAQTINRDAHIFTCVDTGETSDADVHDLIDAPNDVHAGEIETSTTLAVRPHLVRMDRAPRMVPKFSSRFLDFTNKRSVGWYARTKKLSKNGVLGDATKATAEKGEKIWELMTRRLVELVEDLKRLSLDEIYQRRY